MDKITIIGLILGWGSLFGSVLMDNGDIAGYAKASSFVLVVGGTLGATLVCVTLKDLREFPVILKVAFFNAPIKYPEIIDMLVSFATISRREGVLVLEDKIPTLKDEFTKKGLELVVEGVDLENVRRIMETDLQAFKLRYNEGADFCGKMGGFSPTLGIIGTVMGLVEMLRRLDDPGNMGPAIAAAFIATFYGVSAANLIYLPLGYKIKNICMKEVLAKRIIIEGLLAILGGESPRNIKRKLYSYLPVDEQPKEGDKGGEKKK